VITLTGSCDKPSSFADLLVHDMPLDEVAWWNEAAKRAAKYFTDKKAYLRWVKSTYPSETIHFTADACWDIMMLVESQEEGSR
jgi:hypothetical protein